MPRQVGYNRLALMDLIDREAHSKGTSAEGTAFQYRVDEYLVKLAEKMGIDESKITDACVDENDYAIFIP